ncbi:hypothetical protein ACFL9T_04855 [Thermodesulfobacteriota bacterium]
MTTIDIPQATIEMVIDWALLDGDYIEKFVRKIEKDMEDQGCEHIDVEGLGRFTGDEGLEELHGELEEMLRKRRFN